MSGFVVHAWQDVRRQFRLLRRHLRYGRASFAAQPSAEKDAALETLFRVVNQHLRTLGMDYALAFGTLLGWHRNGRPLAHDKDIDFGAPVSAYPIIAASGGRLPRGFTLHDTSHRHPGPKLYVSYRGWEADIYFFAEANGALAAIEHSTNPGDVSPFPREYLYPLQSACFLNEPTFVPAQPVALLEHHYGYIGPDAVRDPRTRYFRRR